MQSRTHAVVDTLGNPLRIHPTAGNVNGIVPVCGLMESLRQTGSLRTGFMMSINCLASVERRNHEVVTPPMSGRLIQREYDAHAYKKRHLVECFFTKLKLFRRVAARYDQLAVTFKAAVILAVCLIWLQ